MSPSPPAPKRHRPILFLPLFLRSEPSQLPQPSCIIWPAQFHAQLQPAQCSRRNAQSSSARASEVVVPIRHARRRAGTSPELLLAASPALPLSRPMRCPPRTTNQPHALAHGLSRTLAAPRGAVMASRLLLLRRATRRWHLQPSRPPALRPPFCNVNATTPYHGTLQPRSPS